MQVTIYIQCLLAYGAMQPSSWCLGGLRALAHVTQHTTYCKDCNNEASTSHSLECDLQLTCIREYKCTINAVMYLF